MSTENKRKLGRDKCTDRSIAIRTFESDIRHSVERTDVGIAVELLFFCPRLFCFKSAKFESFLRFSQTSRMFTKVARTIFILPKEFAAHPPLTEKS